MKFYTVTVFVIFICNLIYGINGCAKYIFVGQDSQCTCPENYVFLNSLQYISSYLPDSSSNAFSLRAFGSIAEWQKLQFLNKTDFQKQVKQWIFYDTNGKHCIYDSNVYFTELLQDLLNNIKTQNYDYGIFIQAETDTIKDLNRALPYASQIAAYHPDIYVWDHSINGDQTGLFSTLTNNQQGHIIRSSTDLPQLVKIINTKMLPDFQSISCGYTPPISSNPVSPIAIPTVSPSCFATTVTSTTTTTPSAGFLGVLTDVLTLNVQQQNNFLLQQRQQKLIHLQIQNTVQFVLDLANKYVFPGESSTNFVRFGVIQFSDDAIPTIPLGNWSRTEFEHQVRSRISYDNGGISNVKSAFLKALTQFQQNSILKNRAIVLIVNDISMFSIGDSLDALSQLKQYVNLPMGAIVPGFWGTPQDALSHLIYLLGNRTDLAFPSLNDALNGIPSVIDSTYPCPTIQPCSALIFVEEATEAIGHPNKVKFLQLAQKLAASTERREDQRFAIALFANGIFHRTELQKYDQFNQTINAFIDSLQADDSPNGGQTRLSPILTDLKNVINSKVVQNYAILLMGELEKLLDPSQASPLAQTIGQSGANVYVLDQSLGTISNYLWGLLTNFQTNHIINGSSNNFDDFYQTFEQTIIYDFNNFNC